ncbi:MAG TPA: N-6 DNA methylase, partial [Anaerolineales bacterium]|nr:N-6 DNA methylase [Anaerolineales bacterium]
MNSSARQTKIEYGDFQTPLELANLVCQKLETLGISPDAIIEPTCGIGSFVEASASHFPNAKKIIGVEVNENYLTDLQNRKSAFTNSERISLQHGNFFDFDWEEILSNLDDSILVIGNFPWVTNSQQGTIGGANLPEKLNFQNRNGFDAMTGKSNF